MKKLITMALGISLFSMSALAQTTPAILPGVPFYAISPDGKMAVSENCIIVDFSDNNKQYNYSEQYGPGSSNCISNTGVVVGYQVGTERGAYWQNGKWNLLPMTDGSISCYARGITPDGSMIVGTIAPTNYAGDYEGLMLNPCVWYRQSDGSYSDPVRLPYPDKDFTGRSPQYVTAVVASNDGKRIAGQIQDFSGFVAQPLVYDLNPDGTWTYTKLLEDLYHPEGIEIPEVIEEAPDFYDFMTPDEIAAYEQALNLWNLLGNGDYSTYPNIYDFMLPSEYEEYYEALTLWNEESEEYYLTLEKVYAAVPTFSFNNVIANSDITLYASTDAKGFYDESTGLSEQKNIIYVIDVESGDYTKYPGEGAFELQATSLSDNGTLFARYRDTDYNIFNGYILLPGETEFQSLYEYVAEIDPSLGSWMSENMTHDYTAVNTEDWTEYKATILATGVPHVTPDMSVIALAQYNFWDYNSNVEYYGYLISPAGLAGIEDITNDDFVGIYPLAGGSLAIKGEVASLEIYSMEGKKMLSIKNPGDRIDTSLPSGLYVVTSKTLSGQNAMKKIIIK